MSEMVDGFNEYRPPHSNALDGKQLTVRGRYVDSAEQFVLTHTFDGDRVHWVLDGESGTDIYELFEMQPGLFYLHYGRDAATHPTVFSAAIDLTSGQMTGAIGQLGIEPGPHLARQQWLQGQVEGTDADPAEAHARTDELIGRRVRYSYSSDDVYDHIYLNENLFTWLCVGGAELGVGDTETCTYWKLREKTYLFSWLEKNMGVEGMVLIDLNAHRSVGIQFGSDQQTAEPINITMGAYAQEFGRAPSIEDARPGPTTS
ncbi:MoaF C-terminal domain-containing protein [Mycolicibacterium sp. CBM1]